MSDSVPSKEQVAKAIDDKDAECHWDGLWNEQKDGVATRAGLLRSSAFTRSLPYWRGLPDDWHEPLSKLLRADREKRKADDVARIAETERQERDELARLLAKYGATHEPPAALEIQNAMAWLRTIELACDARDDRQSVTYIGQIRAILYGLSRTSQPPGDSERLERMEAALRKIARWHNEFPPTERTWDDGSPMSYAALFGSNGERDYMRQVALDALKERPTSTKEGGQ